MKTLNYYETVLALPQVFSQIKCKDLLFAHYDCPPIDPLFGKWSQNNYILYLVSGKLAYHTTVKSWYLTPGMAVFIKKGVGIMEKSVEENPCIMSFFIPDSYLIKFISDYNLITKKLSSLKSDENFNLIIPLDVTDLMKGYFASITPYFNSTNVPSEDMLELKFRELLFNVVTNPANNDIIEYLQTLRLSPLEQLKQIMEANCLYNLSLKDYSKLCHRSLSSFKRDFFSVFKVNSGEWLLEKKLNYAQKILVNSDSSINDICYESGFANPSHFSRVFKKRYGLSPLQFRMQKLETSNS